MGTQAVGRVRSARGSAPTGGAPCQAGPMLAVVAGGASPLIPVPGILERRRFARLARLHEGPRVQVKAPHSYA
jgi:hypothetical protein